MPKGNQSCGDPRSSLRSGSLTPALGGESHWCGSAALEQLEKTRRETLENAAAECERVKEERQGLKAKMRSLKARNKTLSEEGKQLREQVASLRTQLQEATGRLGRKARVCV